MSGRVIVLRGDAAHLPLPDASIDSIVTDPPYGLEFMGREWDTFKPAKGKWGDREHKPTITDADDTPHHRAAVRQPSVLKRCAACGGNSSGQWNRCRCEIPQFQAPSWPMATFQSWCEAWARECLRVLKPGGHLLAFGGTRTWHRLVCGIEDAGFEIRDAAADLTGRDAAGLMWTYGCLTADAEILTEHGWKPGIEVSVGERVAQWDHQTGQISLAPVQQTFRAPSDGPMRVLRNADTDQVLTPNHRVYHQPRQRKMTDTVRRAWFDGRWQVAEADTLSTWNSVRLPLAGEHDGPGVGGEDYAALLGWVWTEGGFDLSGSGVRIYQSSVNADKVAEIAALMDRLGPHKRYDYERTYTRRNGQPHPHTSTTWFFTGELAARVRADLPGKRPTYGLLWRMTGAEKCSLLRAAMLGDGSGFGTRSEQFYQQYEDDLIWLQTLLALIGRAGKVGMRRNRPGGTLYLRNGRTTELQARHLRNSIEHYTGEVWCVRVPTGAFVARRNGRVFITGNSGFPKSLDVSKAIDKLKRRDYVLAAIDLGLEIPGNNLHDWTKAEHSPGDEWWERFKAHLDPEDWQRLEREVTGRASSGRTAGMQQLGPSGIRGGDYEITTAATEDASRWDGWGTALKPGWEPIAVARKPLGGTVAQNVLTHGTGALNIDGCRVGHDEMLTGGTGTAGKHPGWDRPWMHDGQVRNGYESTAGRWPPNVLLSEDAAAEMDRQSGVLTSGVGAVKRASAKGGAASASIGAESRPEGTPMLCYGDTGGASRFFPVFRYEAKADAASRPRLSDGTAWPTVKPVPLMRWLIRLVTPPGGVVADFFAGTGTTGEAAIIEGFDAILMDKDPQAIALMGARFAKPIQPLLFSAEPADPAERARALGVPKPPPVPNGQGDLFDLEAS